MIRLRALAGSAALLLATPGSITAQAQTRPASPSAPPAGARWLVDESGLTCSMGRPVAEGPLTLVIRTYPGSGLYDVSFVGPEWRSRVHRFEEAKLILLPGGTRYDSSGVVTDLGEGRGQALYLGTMPADFLERFSQASAMKLAVGTDEIGTFSLPQAAAVSRVFADCEAGKLIDAGADPAGFGPGATRPRPIGDSYQWLTPADLPRLVESLRYVSAAARLSLNAAGRPESCTVVESNMAQVEQVMCRLVMARARYEPARDRQGSPVATLVHYRVNWVAFLRYDVGPG